MTTQTCRVDQGIVEHYNSGSTGWQKRVNEALRASMSKHQI
ncbi:MAG: BrnA antitoxin family protein [Spongiibacteraceae bacterium]|nr:BrnA antitoxin family protein [Spongiibacteraceae bacterium]